MKQTHRDGTIQNKKFPAKTFILSDSEECGFTNSTDASGMIKKTY